MIFWPNPLVEDAACGEADKSLCLVCSKLEKIKRGCGAVPHLLIVTMKSFLLSVKPAIIAEEKVPALGFEPVGQFLPSTRFKSGINLVQDTAE